MPSKQQLRSEIDSDHALDFIFSKLLNEYTKLPESILRESNKGFGGVCTIYQWVKDIEKIFAVSHKLFRHIYQAGAIQDYHNNALKQIDLLIQNSLWQTRLFLTGGAPASEQKSESTLIPSQTSDLQPSVLIENTNGLVGAELEQEYDLRFTLVANRIQKDITEAKRVIAIFNSLKGSSHGSSNA